MKKHIFLVILIVIILCIAFSCFCALKYVKMYDLLEEGVFCENLSSKDTELILKDFEISNTKYVNTEYLYYSKSLREDYLVLKTILPYKKMELFEEGFSNNWKVCEIQDVDHFIDWWDIPINEKIVEAYNNDCITKGRVNNCILIKCNKGNEVIYYFYTNVYNENALNIVKKEQFLW